MKRFAARALAGLGILAGTAGVASAALSDLKINEISTLISGTDNTEYVELYDGGTLTDLTGVEVRLYTSSDGSLYRTATLSGTMPADGYLVVGAAITPNVDFSTWVAAATTNIIQNGDPDSIVVFDTVGAAVVDAVTYLATYNAVPGTPNLLSTQSFAVEGSPTGVGGDDTMNVFTGAGPAVARLNSSIGRFPDGQDSNDNFDDFVIFYKDRTPGAPNGAAYSATAADPFSGTFATEWSLAFVAPVAETAATALPASMPDSPDPVSPTQWASVKDGSGGGDQMLLTSVLGPDYDVFADFYLGALATAPGPGESEFGGLMARVDGGSHHNNIGVPAFDVTEPVGTYGNSSYVLEIDYVTGTISAVKNYKSTRTVLFTTLPQTTGWHELGIRCDGGEVIFYVDGSVIHYLSGETPRAGYVGVGYRETNAVGAGTVRCNFDDLNVTAVGSLPLPVTLDSFGVE